MLATHSMQLQKEVKSKVAAKKWLDGRLMAKILIMKIQVNLVPSAHFFYSWAILD